MSTFVVPEPEVRCSPLPSTKDDTDDARVTPWVNMTYTDVYAILTEPSGCNSRIHSDDDSVESDLNNELCKANTEAAPQRWFGERPSMCKSASNSDWKAVLDGMHGVCSPDTPPGSLLDPTRPPSPTSVGDFPDFRLIE